MSLPIDEIVAVLAEHLPSAQVQSIAKDLIAAEKAAKEEKAESPKRGKTRLVGFVRVDKGDASLGGVYIASVPDTDGPESETYHGEALLNRIRKAAQEQNESPKKRRAKGKPVKIETWDQAFRYIPAKIFKQSGSQIGVKAKGNAHELVVLTSESIDPR